MDRESEIRYSRWLWDNISIYDYDEGEIRDYISHNNPKIPKDNVNRIVRDWEVMLKQEEEISEAGGEPLMEGLRETREAERGKSFFGRIKAFLKRWF